MACWVDCELVRLYLFVSYTVNKSYRVPAGPEEVKLARYDYIYK
jgi:hypothetical protein